MRLLNKGSTELPYRLHGHIDLGIRYIGRIAIDNSGKL
jgi:hypothetical protein